MPMILGALTEACLCNIAQSVETEEVVELVSQALSALSRPTKGS
jgi:hypothetical protein